MKHRMLIVFACMASGFFACNSPEPKKPVQQYKMDTLKKGSFGFDLDFLGSRDSGLVILKSSDTLAQIIVSPKYQAKVFTSTANGAAGKSYGWVNYKAFDEAVNTHMNAYGGEDRLWLGPEGGKFSLFFKPGAEMVFEQWHTPPAIDTESWQKETQTQQRVDLTKRLTITNYAGTKLDMRLERSVSILSKADMQSRLNISLPPGLKQVGFETNNSIINTGSEEWTEATGIPCLWNLDMFNPSENCVIVIPYDTSATGKIATTDYFGEIPSDRIKMDHGVLYFKADGKSRGKLGLSAARAKDVAGSYDAAAQLLTIIKYDIHPEGKYLNQEWNTEKPVFSGDAMNAYNDGPLDQGGQMGPFYELESVSPAAFLRPGQKMSHRHSVFHFEGEASKLSAISSKLLGVSIGQIENSWKQ
ncbi:DUF6786 family protein [Niabella insulamsoli]|uniref:DUF6786 family protein n=1 Tax=Niabella insulamsoli TaxID=3144874 RepID=UPI0031FE1D30